LAELFEEGLLVVQVFLPRLLLVLHVGVLAFAELAHGQLEALREFVGLVVEVVLFAALGGEAFEGFGAFGFAELVEYGFGVAEHLVGLAHVGLLSSPSTNWTSSFLPYCE
jgi:hypothetical protein